jgi:hypothetical protein
MNSAILLALLIKALMMVESNNNPEAVGDRGQAIGVLQIHKEVVLDVNRIYKTTYRWPEDCRDPKASMDMCHKYLDIYATEKRLGRPVTDKDRAKIWNEGPLGYLSDKEIYWDKVEQQLKKKGG